MRLALAVRDADAAADIDEAQVRQAGGDGEDHRASLAEGRGFEEAAADVHVAADDLDPGLTLDAQHVIDEGLVHAELGHGPGGADLLVRAVAEFRIEADAGGFRSGLGQALQPIDAAAVDQHALRDRLRHFDVGHVVLGVEHEIGPHAQLERQGDLAGAHRIDAITLLDDDFGHRRQRVGLDREQRLEIGPGDRRPDGTRTRTDDLQVIDVQGRTVGGDEGGGGGAHGAGMVPTSAAPGSPGAE